MNSQVFNEDCMTGMARYPDKWFDLAIVDVPYGIGEDGRKNHTRSCAAKSKDYSLNSKYDNTPPKINILQSWCVFHVIKLFGGQIISSAEYRMTVVVG